MYLLNSMIRLWLQELVTTQTAILIVALTIIVIVVVMVVRVLTGRPATNLSKRKSDESEQNDIQKP